MERPEPDENPENEYMAMDPDQWEDQHDTYENADTLGIDIGRRGIVPVPGGATQSANGSTLQTNQIQNSPQPPRLPLPTRYKTIRWPLPNGNREPGKSDDLAFFKKTTVGLVLLCILLLGVLVGLSIVYDILAGIHLKVNKQTSMLQDENQKLSQDLAINKWCRTKYHVSSTEDLESAQELYILNYEALEKYVSNSSFFLFSTTLNNGTCYMNCTC